MSEQQTFIGTAEVGTTYETLPDSDGGSFFEITGSLGRPDAEIFLYVEANGPADFRIQKRHQFRRNDTRQTSPWVTLHEETSVADTDEPAIVRLERTVHTEYRIQARADTGTATCSATLVNFEATS